MQRRDALDVMGLRKHVERLNVDQIETRRGIDQDAEVSGEGLGVARYVDHPGRTVRDHGLQGGGLAAAPWGIEDDCIDGALELAEQFLALAQAKLHVGQPLGVVACVLDGGARLLDRDHGTDMRSQEHREGTHPGIGIDHGPFGPSAHALADHLDHALGLRSVDLEERRGGDPKALAEQLVDQLGLAAWRRIVGQIEARLDHQGALGATDSHVALRRALESTFEGAQYLVDPGLHDRALRDGQKLAPEMSNEAHLTVPDCETTVVAVVPGVFGTHDGGDGRVGEVAVLSQLRHHQLVLELQLSWIGDVLELAPTALRKQRTAGLHPIGRGFEHLEHVDGDPLPAMATDSNHEALTRNRAGGEHQLFTQPTDAISLGGELGDLDLELLVYLVSGSAVYSGV